MRTCTMSAKEGTHRADLASIPGQKSGSSRKKKNTKNNPKPTSPVKKERPEGVGSGGRKKKDIKWLAQEGGRNDLGSRAKLHVGTTRTREPGADSSRREKAIKNAQPVEELC